MIIGNFRFGASNGEVLDVKLPVFLILQICIKKTGNFTSRASPFEAPNVKLPVIHQVIIGNFTFGAFNGKALDVKLPVFLIQITNFTFGALCEQALDVKLNNFTFGAWNRKSLGISGRKITRFLKQFQALSPFDPGSEHQIITDNCGNNW